MKNFLRLCVAVFTFLAGPALAGDDITREIPVDESFHQITITNGFVMQIQIIKGAGFYELCGVGAYRNVEIQRGLRGFMRDSSLTNHGKVALRGFNYFAKVRQGSKFIGELAKCKATNVPLNGAEPNFDIDFSTKGYRF